MKGICVGSDHEKVLFRIGIEEVLGVFLVIVIFFGDLFMKSLSGFFWFLVLFVLIVIVVYSS